MEIGANYQGNDVVEFNVWAPFQDQVDLKITVPDERIIPMKKDESGYWRVTTNNMPAGTQYFYRLNNQSDRPDPASHYQPFGVHKASEVIDHHSFAWTDDNWSVMPLERMIMYEIHIGTFTKEGTFAAAIRYLDDLKKLGINTIEIMPIAQFPGKRNWGYDGVHPFAVQNSYGGVNGLKELVNQCHRRGLAVILDVVYNHLGPEGNYLRDFGPYFTPKYRTPWGEAINFDDEFSDDVRNFFIENALYWFENFHIDALRLDAIHAIFDNSATPFLQELAQRVDEYCTLASKTQYVIAESNLNNTRIIKPVEAGGYGLHAQWSDDFHHSVHTLLTGENLGYYIDYGKIHDLEKALKEGFVYSGQYSAFRKRRYGNSSADLPAHQFVICVQNHDQVGNRALGERLSLLVSFEALKLAAGILLLSPYVPLLFMGEEYGEEAPFHYFVSHTDPGLIRAVYESRKDEFASFKWQDEPPNPQEVSSFQQSKLNWKMRKKGKQKVLRKFYQILLHFRSNIPALQHLSKENLMVFSDESNKIIQMNRWWGKNQIIVIMNFNTDRVSRQLQLPAGIWEKLLVSSEKKWNGPGSNIPKNVKNNETISLAPYSILLFNKDEEV